MNYCRETTKLGTRLRDSAERSEREEDGHATGSTIADCGLQIVDLRLHKTE